jgi:hypothetical protein
MGRRLDIQFGDADLTLTKMNWHRCRQIYPTRTESPRSTENKSLNSNAIRRTEETERQD